MFFKRMVSPVVASSIFSMATNALPISGLNKGTAYMTKSTATLQRATLRNALHVQLSEKLAYFILINNVRITCDS